MISAGQPRIGIVRKRHTEIDLNHLIADRRKPLPTSSVLPGRRLLHEIRFVAGIAVAIGGTGVLLSDLIHLMPALG